MDGKVVRMPISYNQRRKNEKGKGCVPCQVTGRYLDFNLKSAILNVREVITIDVMTSDTSDDKDRLITRIIVRREDLFEVLSRVQGGFVDR